MAKRSSLVGKWGGDRRWGNRIARRWGPLRGADGCFCTCAWSLP